MGNLSSITGWIEDTKGKGESIDELDSAHELNALHYAIIFKKKDVVEALLESKAKPNRPGGGLSPLQLAIIGPTPFQEAIELLIKHGYGDVNRVIGSLVCIMSCTVTS